MSRVPKNRPSQGTPIRLGAEDEVRPLRLEVPLRPEPVPAATPSADAAAPRGADPSATPLAASAASAAPVPLPPRWDGAGLRAAREAAGMSIAALAGRTRLTRTTLEAIEAQRVEGLPRAYLKGFLTTIARELGVDGREVTRSYLDALAPPTPAGEGSGPIR